jgi:hypothetical protein
MSSAGDGMLVLEQHWRDVTVNFRASIGEKSRTSAQQFATKIGETAERSAKNPEA